MLNHASLIPGLIQNSNLNSNSNLKRAIYLDGLRFICAWIVVNQHFTNGFFPFESGDAENAVNYQLLDSQSIWRATPLRILIGGTFPVYLFFVLSGISLSFSTHSKLTVKKNDDDVKVYHGIRDQWIKRYLRLMVPFFVISWLYHLSYKLGLFTYADETALLTQSSWLARYSLVWQNFADGSECKFWSQFHATDILTVPYFLYESLVAGFIYTSPRYAVQFWTIPIFLYGSFIALGVLLAIGTLIKPSCRYFLYLVLLMGMLMPNWLGALYRNVGAATFYHLYFITGVILGDLLVRLSFYEKVQQWSYSSSSSWWRKMIHVIWCCSLAFLTLYMGSYPNVIPTSQRSSFWSAVNRQPLIQASGGFYPYWVGSVSLFLWLFSSSWFQNFLSWRLWVWLGGFAFEIYLIHNLWMFSLAPSLFKAILNSSSSISYVSAAFVAYLISFFFIIGSAWLIYYFISSPFEPWLKKCIAYLTDTAVTSFYFEPKHFYQAMKSKCFQYRVYFLVGGLIFITSLSLQFGVGVSRLRETSVHLQPVIHSIVGTLTKQQHWYSPFISINASQIIRQSTFMYTITPSIMEWPQTNLMGVDRLFLPWYEHYPCGRQFVPSLGILLPMVVSTSSWFDYTQVAGYVDAICKDKSESILTGAIMNTHIQSFATLFLSSQVSQSNLQPIYQHMLWFQNQIQDHVLTNVPVFNPVYTSQLIGYTWLKPSFGATLPPLQDNYPNGQCS